jgi:hypothetical protein
MLPWLQDCLEHESLYDNRPGQSLDALVAAHRHDVCGAIVRNALEVYATPTPRPLALGLTGVATSVVLEAWHRSAPSCPGHRARPLARPLPPPVTTAVLPSTRITTASGVTPPPQGRGSGLRRS